MWECIQPCCVLKLHIWVHYACVIVMSHCSHSSHYTSQHSPQPTNMAAKVFSSQPLPLSLLSLPILICTTCWRINELLCLSCFPQYLCESSIVYLLLPSLCSFVSFLDFELVPHFKWLLFGLASMYLFAIFFLNPSWLTTILCFC